MNSFNWDVLVFFLDVGRNNGDNPDISGRMETLFIIVYYCLSIQKNYFDGPVQSEVWNWFVILFNSFWRPFDVLFSFVQMYNWLDWFYDV
jgi:hypothetical protein